MTIAARLDKLDERERKLLVILGWVVGVLIVLVVPIVIVSALSSKRAANDEYKSVLAAIDEARSTMNERKARHDALLAKYLDATPALAGFIEQAAKSQSLSAADTQDKPETPHGKRYTERFTVVKMHKIGMRPLVEMLQQIESSGHPVAVTRLNIKPRAGEPDQYEIELGVSAFDRKSDKSDSGAKGAASASPSASASAEESP
jgi:general secretion pathway protein M